MNASTTLQRWTATGLLATSILLTLAPAAEAGHRWRRYKGAADCNNRRVEVSRVVVREHSSAGPAIAGLIGGFILGAAVSQSRPVVVHERECAPPPPRWRYYDPYCGDYMEDLDECRVHCRDHRHPRVVRVIDIETGRCVRDLRWYDGGWHEEDMDWDD